MGQNNTTIFNIKQINRRAAGKGSLTAAARHNKRTITDASGRHDVSRSHLNRSLLGLPDTPEAVTMLADRLLSERGYVPKRPDATIAAEGVFSLLEEPATFDMAEFFSECATWLQESLGGQLLSADVHLDEDHPHCHVLVLLPLSSDKGAPSGSNIIGYKQSTQDRKRDLQQKVAAKYGLRVVSAEMTPDQRKVLARDVQRHLRAIDDPALSSQLRAWIGHCIDRDPVSPARELGLPMPGSGSLAVLALSAGRGPRTAAAEAAGNDRLLQAAMRHAQASGPEEPMPTPMGVAAFLSSPPGEGTQQVQHPCSVGVATFSSIPSVPVPVPVPVPVSRVDRDELGTVAAPLEPLAPNAIGLPAFHDMAVHFWHSPGARKEGRLPHFTWCADGTTREREESMPSDWWGRHPMQQSGDDGEAAAREQQEEACM